MTIKLLCLWKAVGFGADRAAAKHCQISCPQPRSISSSERESTLQVKCFRRESNRWSKDGWNPSPQYVKQEPKIFPLDCSHLSQRGTGCPWQEWMMLLCRWVLYKWSGGGGGYQLALVEQVDLGCWDQEDRFRESIHERAISIAWFILSVRPLVPNWQTGSGSQEAAERPPEHWGKLGPFV